MISITTHEVFCKDLIDISYQNALLLVLEDSIWLQLICFLTVIAFWFVKSGKEFTSVFIA